MRRQSPYPFEIIVADDCSPDQTPAILTAYAARYPRIINAILREVNYHSLGKKNFPELVKLARGEFSAVCEGDDFWLDPHKLADQIAYMRANPSVNLTFTGSKMLRAATGAYEADQSRVTDLSEIQRLAPFPALPRRARLRRTGGLT